MSSDKDYDEYTDKLEQVKDDFDAAIEQRDYALKTVVAFKEENTHLRAMNFRLVEALASQAPLATTHYEGCYDSGPKHYECALLKIKQLVTPMMEFKQDAVAKADYERGFDDGFYLRNEKDGKRTWVGLTEDEKHDCYLKIDVWSRCVEAVEAKLKEKNCG